MDENTDLAHKYLAWVDAVTDPANIPGDGPEADCMAHWVDPKDWDSELICDVRGQIVNLPPVMGDDEDISDPFVMMSVFGTRLVVLSDSDEVCIWTPRKPDAVLSHPKGAMLVWHQAEA